MLQIWSFDPAVTTLSMQVDHRVKKTLQNPKHDDEDNRIGFEGKIKSNPSAKPVQDTGMTQDHRHGPKQGMFVQSPADGACLLDSFVNCKHNRPNIPLRRKQTSHAG